MFNLAADNPEILTVQHLRKIVPRLDIYELWPEVLPSVADPLTLSCVIWTLLSPSSCCNGFKISQAE
jgi:hypothetical protein